MNSALWSLQLERPACRSYSQRFYSSQDFLPTVQSLFQHKTAPGLQCQEHLSSAKGGAQRQGQLAGMARWRWLP